MAAQRLSKLQKWILVNCYNTTVLKKRDDNVLIRCKDYDADVCCDSVVPVAGYKYTYDCNKKGSSKKSYNCSAFQFTQYEIYYYYYGMELSKLKTPTDFAVYFKHTPESEKRYINTSRSLKNLAEKGFIKCFLNDRTKTIILTESGIKTTEALLSSS